MSSHLRDGKAIRAEVDSKVNTLVASFQSLLAESMSGSRRGKTDLPTTMDRNMQMGLTTQVIVRAVEDLTVLSRHLQELWFFGGLETYDDSQKPEAEKEDLVQLATDVIAAGLKEQS